MNTEGLMRSVAMEKMLDSFYDRVCSTSSEMEARTDIGFMKLVCDVYDLKHAAYITVDKRSILSRKPKFLVTYPEEWQDEYRRSFAESKDPVIQAGLTELLPFDWRDLRQRNPQAEELFGTAQEFGIGQQGMTIPVRGDHGTRALFSLTADFGDWRWKEFKREYRKDFVILANYFHKKLSGAENNNRKMLTERELEVLQLSSLGYTAIDISQKLEISVATVKYFLNQSRWKLNSMNTTQTVAKALQLGLIV